MSNTGNEIELGKSFTFDSDGNLIVTPKISHVTSLDDVIPSEEEIKETEMKSIAMDYLKNNK